MKNSPKLSDSCIDLVVEVCPVDPTHEEHANVNALDEFVGDGKISKPRGE